MLPQVDLMDLWELQKNQEVTQTKLVNVRGCNGSGKSTIPFSMLGSDENAFEVVWQVGGKQRILATVFPKYNYAAIGKYQSKCGGMDTMKNTEEIKVAVETMWNMNYNLLMEGIMASTVRQTYIDLFTELNTRQELKRDIIIFSILPPLKVCLQRIQERNGGKAIKEELVDRKRKIVENNVSHFRDAGFTSLRVSNDKISKDETLKWFFEQLGQQESKKIESSKEELPVMPEDEIAGYEWAQWYKKPDSTVVMNQEYRDTFWWFIYERLRIYYKRVILGQDRPWTDDKVLREYRFTNICRDMDRLTIYERDNILKKIDEPVADVELRKKSVMFNIMLFRTFVKIETYEAFGFIDFAEDWQKQWKKGKKILLDRREKGIQNFTGAFMTNNLRNCNPDEETKNNKTMNALCMVEAFIDNIDEIYKTAILSCKNMKEQLQYLITLKGVGGFTAYEFACSFAMANRYCKNRLVSWTQDSYTNIGPGSQGGIKWIFQNRGNLSEIECIVYLRSIWKQEMQRLGYYKEFIKMLPSELDKDLDMRIIEHCLCETHKYNKLNTTSGRSKERFEPRTKDVQTLIL